jgi:hypothetical protein
MNLRALLTTLLVVSPSLSRADAPAPAKPGIHLAAAGILIYKGNHVAWETGDAREYSNLDLQFNPAFHATMLDGTDFSDTKDKIRYLAYGQAPSDQVIEEMEAWAKTYRSAAPILAPRLAWLKEELAHPKKIKKIPSIPEIEDRGTTYKNVRPGNLRNGVLGFVHESGAFACRVENFSHQSLELFSKLNPDLQENREFQQLMASYVPSLYVGNTLEYGVKIASSDHEGFSLLTNHGLVKTTRHKLTKEGLATLEQAREVEEIRIKDMQTRLDAEEARSVAEAKASKEAADAAEKYRQDKIRAEEKQVNHRAVMAGMFLAKPLWDGLTQDRVYYYRW